jgi:hypothetical protein
MKRALPLVAAVAVLAGGIALRPGAETGACAAEGGAVVPRSDCAATAATSPQSCAATTEGFRTVRARPGRGGVDLAFSRRVRRPVQIDVFQVATTRTVLRERLVARFTNRTETVRWNGRAQRGRKAVRDGLLFARFRLKDERGRTDERRVTLRRLEGRFSVRPDFYRRASCGSLTAFKLERAAFTRSLGIAYRLARAGTVTVEIRRGGRVVRRLRATRRAALRTYRARFDASRARRGLYEVRLVYTSDQGSLTSSLYAQRL